MQLLLEQMDKGLTLSAGWVRGVEDMGGDGVEVLRGVVQPVDHSLHALLVILHHCSALQTKEHDY